jgi:5-methylcytosine-specific restriction endonuclease McrA
MIPRSLLLNANDEPLHVTDARRALYLVEVGKADLVIQSEHIAHTRYVDYILPSVIRLRRYVSVPRGRSIPITTRSVLARDRGVCAYCGDVANTMDHIRPRAQGGPHVWENIVAACFPCNHKKGNRTPEQALMPLRYQPSRPRGAHAKLLLYAISEEWEPYLLAAVS